MRWKRIMHRLFPSRARPPESPPLDAVINEAILAGQRTGAAAGEMVEAARQHRGDVKAEQARMERSATARHDPARSGQTTLIRDLVDDMLATQIPADRRKG